MRFTIFKGEKSITEVAKRLFDIQGRGSKAKAKEAADALLKANPHLNDLSTVPPGSLIAIPRNAPPVTPGEEVTAAVSLRVLAAQNMQDAFDSMQQRLSAIETLAVEQVKSATQRFAAPEVAAALKTAAEAKFVSPVPISGFDSMANDASETLKSIQAAKDQRQEAATQLRTALEAFTK